jgi:hypothetical protein
MYLAVEKHKIIIKYRQFKLNIVNLPPSCRRTSQYRRQFFAAADLSKLRGLPLEKRIKNVKM